LLGARDGAGQAEFMRVLLSAERSRNAGDADQVPSGSVK